MVWGTINSNFWSDLVIINGNLTAQHYISQIVNPVIIPLFQRNGVNCPLTLQQGNARAHAARLTQNHLRAYGINVMDWPGVSPDINYIEHYVG